ncbi:MAG: murein transglycosylase domain-containing protein [Sulfurimonas sp.]|nr:murein transglycosylase domain-containing protein [Sulfurimonas sp.]
MKRYIIFAIIAIVLTGCGASDYSNILRASISKDPSAAFKVLAENKSIQYATNPSQLSRDIKNLDKNIFSALVSMFKDASKSWGEDNVKVPSKEEYVKYMQNYKSRALVDFDNGLITVETLDTVNSKKSLKNAIVTTLLLPDDPRSADLFGAKKIKLGETPYLLGEVKDDQGKNIRYSWRAERYADILLAKNYKLKNIVKDSKTVQVHYVTMPMVKDHSDIRVAKFKPHVKRYAKEFNVSENLIYAIMQAESNFNQYAVSGAGAFGLMQIVPSSAGKDAYKLVKGKSGTPSKSYLFNAQNNIELGVAYIHILNDRYLPGITNPISKEYCVISAYNTGSGNVLKTFHSNRDKAKDKINSQSASMVYKKLRSDLPYEETRRYLKKVIDYKKDFVRL